MHLAQPSADRIREKRVRDWGLTHPILQGHEQSIEVLLNHYIHGGGTQAEHIVRQLRTSIDKVAVTQKIILEGESVFDRYGRITLPFLRHFCPLHIDCFYDVGPDDVITNYELLPAGPNEFYSVDLPPPLNRVLQRQRRPAFVAYSTTAKTLHVSSDGHQLFDDRENWFWPSASSRILSKIVTAAPFLRITDHLVVIQDRFPGENFAHFLFDWIPRLGLFLESGLQKSENCLFIMAGIPDEFRLLLLRSISDIYGLEPHQFFFPEDGVNLVTEGYVYWFSDQVDTYMHPAQMAHPRSVDIIRKATTKIPVAPGRFRYLYISRSDTGRRRVANEDLLWRELSKYGFEMVRLADHSLTEQIALVRGAEHIVAPHGMGLTHVSLHGGQTALLEFQHPRAGTDAYAIMAAAMGFPYGFIIGTPIDNEFDDYTVPPEAIAPILDRLGVSPGAHNMRSLEINLIPASRTFTGNWSPGAQLEELAALSGDIAERFPGSAVMRHVRRNPEARRETNCGAWWGIRIDASRIYTATCWVWVPADFVGSEVLLSLGEWQQQRRQLADLTKRNCWQRLRTTVTAPRDAVLCAAVIRIDAADGSAVYSTCWQIEPAPEPTDYVATG